MKRTIGVFFLFLTGCAAQPFAGESPAKSNAVFAKPTHAGFFDLSWDETQGKLFLHVSKMDTPFIYQTALARGIGSNDIGADRGRLGSTRLVEFFRSGSRLLLIENNMAFRADSLNKDEQNAVKESFARSVLWGFTVVKTMGDTVVVDATDFFLRDAIGLSPWLANMELGSFSVDNSRSAIYLPRTRAFADNTEVEVMLTLTGTPKGEILHTVVPDPTAITVHTHHSFVRLPDDGYEPLDYDPRSGFLDPTYGGSFSDYAVPIDTPVHKAYARRHRLQKKNPEASISEPVEPIIYYLDRGVPEPVRSALLEGASWWDQAFAAAGYKNAFRVELLPVDADPLDIHYNVIQWVHRSTRGWSYGSSIIDPRTGEILKGHVSLGSLRVRQDFLLAEGLLAPYTGDQKNPAMEAFALARIRQLSAHEVGHTLGLEHNFAGSVNDRASVMDYPFPRIKFNANDEFDLSDAYAVGIGEWDKRAILWGYQDFPAGVDERTARHSIIKATYESGLKYVADNDARSIGSAHAHGSLWDNGADPVKELQHLMRVRARVIGNFSEANIQTGRPMATLEEVLVPMYLLHRYQIQAVGKLIGGGYYTYDLKGDGQPGFKPVAINDQQTAAFHLLQTLRPENLVLPDALIARISPRPPGFDRGRETFERQTGPLFDPYAPADAAIALTLDVLLDPERCERLVHQQNEKSLYGVHDIVLAVASRVDTNDKRTGAVGEIQRRLNLQIIGRLGALANSATTSDSVRGAALVALEEIQAQLTRTTTSQYPSWQAHDALALRQLRHLLEDTQEIPPPRKPTAPPGSPIGH